MQPRQESLQQSRIKSFFFFFLPRSRASICPCIEAVPTFNFVIKLPWHFICIETTSTLHPCRNRDNIHLCHEIMSTLHLYRGHANIASLPLKLHQHFICRSRDNIHEAMSTLHIAIGAMSTLYSHRNCANVHFCHEAMTTLHFLSKPWSHVNTPFALKLCQHSSLSWNYVNTSFVPKPCQRSSLPWNHDTTPH